jgi:ubiquinone/menaquinone biosynthesis C-methylase UbiE
MLLSRYWWSLVRFGFRLLYNELAFTYDLVSWVVSLGQWRAWQRAAIPCLSVAPGDTVLEIAHGTGGLQLDLRTAGVQTVGLDRSPQMGRIARRKMQQRGFRPRLARGNALALPFPTGSFRAVVSTFPTEFFLDARTLAETHRVLLPGGRLVIVANGRLTGRDPLSRLLELAYAITGQRGPWPIDNTIERFRRAGLPAQLLSRPLHRSEVWLVIAQKSQSR